MRRLLHRLIQRFTDYEREVRIQRLVVDAYTLFLMADWVGSRMLLELAEREMAARSPQQIARMLRRESRVRA
jgi:hypothetical protein